MANKKYLPWLAGVVALDLALIGLGVFGAQWWGLRILALALAAVGLVTFGGILCAFHELEEASGWTEGPMRNAIAASVVIMYLATVGVVSFYPLVEAGGQAPGLNPMTKAMLDSFHTVVLVVVGFYFASSAVAGARQK
jgi:hypothetical protein